MDLHLVVAVLCIGAGVGFLSGAFGKGGSAVSTPLLHAVGVPAITAVASPLPATIPATLLAGRRYVQAGEIDHALLRRGLMIGLPTTAAGAMLTRWIPGGALVLATDVILLVLALRMLAHAHGSEDAPEPHAAPVARVFLVVGVVGIVSGLLGNSGGFLLAPLFVNVLGVPLRRALGTSLVLSAALAVPGTIVHAWLGHIDWSLTLLFGLAAVPLASLGARVALRTRERSLTLVYAGGLASLSIGLLAFAR